MYIIKVRSEDVVAIVDKNIVFTADDNRVIGIIIGDCLYGKSKVMVGKIFNSTVYLINGEIIGKVEVSSQHKIKTIRKDHLAEAWSILTGVKEHTTKWIVEKNTWSKIGLIESLN
jgi:hypothetical protein